MNAFFKTLPLIRKSFLISSFCFFAFHLILFATTANSRTQNNIDTTVDNVVFDEHDIPWDRINKSIIDRNYNNALQEIPDLTQYTGDFLGKPFLNLFMYKAYCLIKTERTHEAFLLAQMLENKCNDNSPYYPAFLFMKGAIDCIDDNYGIALETFTTLIEKTGEPTTSKEITFKYYLHQLRACIYCVKRMKKQALEEIEIAQNLKRKHHDIIVAAFPAEVDLGVYLNEYAQDTTGEVYIHRSNKEPLTADETQPPSLILFWEIGNLTKQEK